VANTANDPMNNDGWKDFLLRQGFGGQGDTGFVQFWHRWYDSEDGRWISKDPIGIEGGMNLFGYLQNNTVNGVDVTGLTNVPPPIILPTETPCPPGLCSPQKTIIEQPYGVPSFEGSCREDLGKCRLDAILWFAVKILEGRDKCATGAVITCGIGVIGTEGVGAFGYSACVVAAYRFCKKLSIGEDFMLLNEFNNKLRF